MSRPATPSEPLAFSRMVAFCSWALLPGLAACTQPGEVPAKERSAGPSAPTASTASGGEVGDQAATASAAEIETPDAPRPVDGARSCQRAEPGAQCCDREFGLDPAQVVAACGFESYLGEYRTPTTCQLRFDAGRNTPAALTLASFEGLDFDAAVALHMSGFMGVQVGDEVEDAGRHGPLHLSGLGKLAWGYVDGWSAPRRVAWSKAECPAPKLRPVLEAMAKATEVPAPPSLHPIVGAPPAPRPLPPGTHEGSEGSLLASYAQRPLETPAELLLPAHSMRMVIMLLERAGQDTVRDFEVLFAQDARFGLPDRHELRARPVLRDGGWALLESLRAAASRFGADAKFACPPLSPQGSEMVAKGEAPMWCTYVSADGLDLMVFRMRMRDAPKSKGKSEGKSEGKSKRAQLEYVGLFETRPTSPLRADGEPPPPPLRPSDKLRAERRAETSRAAQAAQAKPQP